MHNHPAKPPIRVHELPAWSARLKEPKAFLGGGDGHEFNHRYKAAIAQTLPRADIPRLIAARREYITALKERVPFFKRLLGKQEPFVFRDGGKAHNFVLLKTGMAMKEHARPVAIVISPSGEAMLFYKSTGSNSGIPGEWIPFNTTKWIKDDPKHGSYWWYQKFQGHPGPGKKATPEMERALRIGKEIKAREKGIEFLDKWGVDEIAAIGEML